MTERLTDERVDEIYGDIQTWVESDTNNIDRVDLLTAMFELREDNAALRADNASLAASLQGEVNARDNAVLAEKMRMMAWCGKRTGIQSRAWQRAARKALSGDMAELRNRIALIDAGPLDIALSDAAIEPKP